MTDSCVVPHNIIKLQLPDGREVSIIQSGNGREGDAYGHADQHMVEVWVEGEPDVKGHLNLSELVEYLRYLDTTQTLSGLIDASKYEVENYDEDLADWAAEDEAIFLNEDRIRQGRQQ